MMSTRTFTYEVTYEQDRRRALRPNATVPGHTMVFESTDSMGLDRDRTAEFRQQVAQHVAQHLNVPVEDVDVASDQVFVQQVGVFHMDRVVTRDDGLTNRRS